MTTSFSCRFIRHDAHLIDRLLRCVIVITAMAKRTPTKKATISEVLREAINQCDLSFQELERQTGVKRQSMMKFVRSEQSLRLDIADKLADFFELEVTRRKAK